MLVIGGDSGAYCRGSVVLVPSSTSFDAKARRGSSRTVWWADSVLAGTIHRMASPVSRDRRWASRSVRRTVSCPPAPPLRCSTPRPSQISNPYWFSMRMASLTRPAVCRHWPMSGVGTKAMTTRASSWVLRQLHRVSPRPSTDELDHSDGRHRSCSPFHSSGSQISVMAMVMPMTVLPLPVAKLTSEMLGRVRGAMPTWEASEHASPNRRTRACSSIG